MPLGQAVPPAFPTGPAPSGSDSQGPAPLGGIPERPGAQPGSWNWAATARYRAGAEHQILRASPENLARLQQALVSAGLLTGQFAMGVADTKTQTAMRNLMGFANQINATWQEALPVYGEMAVNARGGVIGSGGGSGGGSAAPEFAPQVTSTEDLTLALKDASAQLRAGGAFDDATIGRLVGVYQAQEAQEQEAAFNAELHGGTIETPTSAETMLRNTIREADPAGVGAREVAERYNDFLGMLNNNGLGPVKL